MKICVVSYKFGTGQEIGQHLGLYSYFLKELETLTAKGVKVFVVTPWLSWIAKGTSQIGSIKIYRTWPKMLPQWWLWPINRIIRQLYFWTTQWQVLKLSKQEKIDLVYVWQARETGQAIAQIKYKLKCPIVFRQITTWFWNFDKTTQEYFTHSLLQKMMGLPLVGRFFVWLFEFLREKKRQIHFAREIYRNFDRVLFLSQALMDEAINKLKMAPYKGGIVPLAVEPKIFRPVETTKLKKKYPGPIVFYAGRINIKKKGLDYLLEAFQKVVSEIPQAKLCLAGGGSLTDLEQFKKLVKQLGLEESVILLGEISNQALPQYYSLADLSVVPSVWLEAFGRVIIEAMACGRPVVSTNVGGIEEINIDGETGLVVEPKNQRQLAQAILKLLKDEPLRKKLGQQARKRAAKYYTYQAVSNKLIDIFNQCILKSF